MSFRYCLWWSRRHWRTAETLHGRLCAKDIANPANLLLILTRPLSQSNKLISLYTNSFLNCGLQRFYQTLSDLKGEVENTIKKGREIVEEKSASDPEKLTAKLDSLKELYNKVRKSFCNWSINCHLWGEVLLNTPCLFFSLDLKYQSPRHLLKTLKNYLSVCIKIYLLLMNGWIW